MNEKESARGKRISCKSCGYSFVTFETKEFDKCPKCSENLYYKEGDFIHGRDFGKEAYDQDNREVGNFILGLILIAFLILIGVLLIW